MPKLLELRLSPRPKWYCQIRLASTRAVSGFSGDTSHFASTSRLPVEVAPGGGVGITGCFALRIPGNAGSTLFSGLVSACGLPR